MRSMAYKGKAIENSISIPAAYIVFVGYQSGIYTKWKKYYEQIFSFNGACCRHYYSLKDQS